jgi:hypothetical protein
VSTAPSTATAAPAGLILVALGERGREEVATVGRKRATRREMEGSITK